MYVREPDSHVQCANPCAPWKLASGAGCCSAGAAVSKDGGVSPIPRRQAYVITFLEGRAGRIGTYIDRGWPDGGLLANQQG
jgi:hypothetical protein